MIYSNDVPCLKHYYHIFINFTVNSALCFAMSYRATKTILSQEYLTDYEMWQAYWISFMWF